MLYQTIVFAPLIGALFAGFLGRKVGETPSMAVTTLLLFVSAALSWVALFQVGFGHAEAHITLFRWMDVGGFNAA